MSEFLSWFLVVGPLSCVIFLAWVATWWRERPRPGLVATVGLAAGVLVAVVGGRVPNDGGGSGLASVSTEGFVLTLNGMLAVVVSAALLVVSGIVALVREARREARAAQGR